MYKERRKFLYYQQFTEQGIWADIAFLSPEWQNDNDQKVQLVIPQKLNLGKQRQY